MATETTQADQSKQPAAQETTEAARLDAKQEAKQAAQDEVKTSDLFSRVHRAEAIVRRNVLWSLGVGAVPVPIIDVVGLIAVQLKMLSELSDLYGVKFTEDLAKKILGSLLSSLGGLSIGAIIGGSFAKFLPVVGTALGIVTIPITAGACTHATGTVFLMHFESGGTLLDFDPQAVRAYFRNEFEQAKETVVQIHQDEKVKAGTRPF